MKIYEIAVGCYGLLKDKKLFYVKKIVSLNFRDNMFKEAKVLIDIEGKECLYTIEKLLCEIEEFFPNNYNNSYNCFNYGIFLYKNNDFIIFINGVFKTYDDMSIEIKKYLDKCLKKHIYFEDIIEVEKPKTESQENELRIRTTQLQSIMENNLFEENEEDLFTCEWQQLNKLNF